MRLTFSELYLTNFQFSGGGDGFETLSFDFANVKLEQAVGPRLIKRPRLVASLSRPGGNATGINVLMASRGAASPLLSTTCNTYLRSAPGLSIRPRSR